MDSDSDTFSDAREDLLDSPTSACFADTNRWDTKIRNNMNTSSDPTLVNAEEEFGVAKKPVDSEGDSKTPNEFDPNEVRRTNESLLDNEELEKRRASAKEMKERGNELFKEAKYTEALQCYTEALDLCPLAFEIDRSVLLSNRAACHVKLDATESALSDCDAALALQPHYLKCLMRRATLREEKERLTEALEDYQSLLKLDPGNEKARWACMTLPDRIKQQQEEMKEKMLDQLKQLGNMVLKPFGLSTDNFKVQKNPDSEGYSINFVR